MKYQKSETRESGFKGICDFYDGVDRKYDKYHWIVSIVRASAGNGNHAEIVIEGIDSKGEHFAEYADFSAGWGLGCGFHSTYGKVEGFIKVTEKFGIEAGKSWLCKKEKVEAMKEAIKQELGKEIRFNILGIDSIIAAAPITVSAGMHYFTQTTGALFALSSAGIAVPYFGYVLILGGLGSFGLGVNEGRNMHVPGYNCISWAVDKLKVAGIDLSNDFNLSFLLNYTKDITDKKVAQAPPNLDDQRGVIINTDDTNADNTLKDDAVNGQTTASPEFQPEVRVNGVAPGAIAQSENANESTEEEKQMIIAQTPSENEDLTWFIEKEKLLADCILEGDASVKNGQVVMTELSSQLFTKFVRTESDAVELLGGNFGDKYIILLEIFKAHNKVPVSLLSRLDDYCCRSKQLLEAIFATEGSADKLFDALAYAADKPQTLQVILNRIVKAEDKVLLLERQVEHDRCTLMHYAVINHKSLEIILDIYPRDKLLEALNVTDKHNRTVLFNAALNYPESLDIILKKLSLSEEDIWNLVNTTHGQGKNMLMHIVVCNHKSLQVVLNYLPGKRHLEAMRLENIYPVMGYAIRNVDSLRTILNVLGKESFFTLVKSSGSIKIPVIHFAVVNHEGLQFVLGELKEDERLELVKMQDNISTTLLQRAADNPESLRVILSSLKEEELLDVVKMQNELGETALHGASGNPESLRVILRSLKKEDLLDVFYIQNRRGKTALHKAADNPESLRVILSSLKKEELLNVVDIQNELDETVLHGAIKNPESLKIILGLLKEEERSILVKIKNKLGDTSLHRAAENLESLKVILGTIKEEQLLDVVNMQNNDGETVLHKAADNPESLRVILGALKEEDRIIEAVKLCYSKSWPVLHNPKEYPNSLKTILNTLLIGSQSEKSLEPHNLERIKLIMDIVKDLPLEKAKIIMDRIIDVLGDKGQFKNEACKESCKYLLMKLCEVYVYEKDYNNSWFRMFRSSYNWEHKVEALSNLSEVQGQMCNIESVKRVCVDNNIAL